MPKNLLIIRADSEQVPDEHLDAFTAMAKQINVDVEIKDISSIGELEKCLNGSNKYVCFAGHGNSTSFGDNEQLSISWSEIGELLCKKGCFLPNAKILLYCCFGGLKEVSCTLMDSCPKLDFIIGCKTEIHSIDMLNAFSIFLYNMERNYHIGDVKSAHRTLYGTGILIKHYSRNEYNEQTKEHICQDCEEYKALNDCA